MKLFSYLLIFLNLTIMIFAQDSIKSFHSNQNKNINKFNLFPPAVKNLKLSSSGIQSIINKAKNYPLEDIKDGDIVFMETSLGKLEFKLFSDVAPNHCINFKRLANSGFYDGTLFHRVIKDYIIQGGDILSRDHEKANDGTGGPGWTIESEFSNKSHKRGSLSMIRSADPNSAGSQFFICINDSKHLDNKYTIFGEVSSNMHILDRISNSETHYSKIKKKIRYNIPEGDDPKKWIKLKDPKTGENFYSKIPQNLDSIKHKSITQKLLYNDAPISDIVIKKIRVKSLNETN